MNPMDLLILILVVGGGFLGWVNGLVKWLFAFLGFIVGVFVASRLYETLDWAIPLVDSDGVRQLVIFILIVGAASIGGWMLGRAIKMTLSILMLGWVDRGVGMAFGLLVGLLGASAVALAVTSIPVDELQQAVEDSLLTDVLLDATTFLRGFMPSEFDVKGSLFGGADSA
ncbi:MAG: CvpA family protein [Chloroflexi bacterium]|nr:CvpA family protein [Chloroflexota bacterium]